MNTRDCRKLTDLLDDLMEPAPEEGSLPVLTSGTEGESGAVEHMLPQASAPVPFSPEPAATLARRIIGTPRKVQSGLKRLSQRHKLIIGLHLSGKSSAHVADVVGCSEASVGRIIRDPLAQEVIAFYYEGVESELKALFPKVVDAVRDALGSATIGTRLQGVDRYAKLTGIDGKDKGEKAVTVNVILDARKKFVQEVRAAEAKVPVVEIEATPAVEHSVAPGDV